MTRRLERITQLPSLPPRAEDAHKGTFGRALIVGGSRGMSGAVSLAGLGALRGGAGLVYLAVPSGILSIVASVEPSYLTIPLPEDDHGRIGADAQKTLGDVILGNTAVAVGPGWGRSAGLISLARWLLRTTQLPMVVDADGLNALAAIPEVLASSPAPRILTPHPGEFARLLNTDVANVQKNREKATVQFAKQHGVVLVLKGHGTVITDGRRLAVNTTGNSGMATGGSGDVLTGLMTALLAQGLSPFDAAQLGAHLHGMAGDMAAEALSKPAMIASDIAHFLTQAWKRLAEMTNDEARMTNQ